MTGILKKERNGEDENLQYRLFFHRLWRLLREYWRSEQKWKARGLLFAVVSLNLVGVYMLVLLNRWYNTFYGALQKYEQASFWPLIGQFCAIACIYIIVSVYAIYLRQMLQISWRDWMTRRYLGDWLGDQTYYKLQIDAAQTDNPDQRIGEDIQLFVTLTLQLSVELFKQFTIFVSFIAVLWQLSGIMTFSLGNTQITVYGYMVWLSLLYAAAGTFLTTRIGNPLIRLNYEQQKFEADFRYHMVRLRENGESVAFYRGEGPESAGLVARFMHIYRNYRQLMKFEKRLSWFQSGYGQLAVIFPIVFAAPRYFSGQIHLGGLTRTTSAFDKVQSSLSFFVEKYTYLAQWNAVVQRLVGFKAHMEAVEKLRPECRRTESADGALHIENLTLRLPAGRVLLQDLRLDLEAGGSLLITGASGSGKSTLLRALAGIWPFVSGTVAAPQARRLFLPQRPYLPLGTLREVLFYPQAEAAASDDEIRTVLEKCRLTRLADSLDAVDDWARILSLGEQQRIAFARVLLVKPAWVYLDEATSALDEPAEAAMYALLCSELPQMAVVSVGHRSTLKRYHAKQLQLEEGRWSLSDVRR